jgi:hypothetical protein
MMIWCNQRRWRPNPEDWRNHRYYSFSLVSLHPKKESILEPKIAFHGSSFPNQWNHAQVHGHQFVLAWLKDMRLHILSAKSNGWNKKSEEISKCSHNSEHKLIHSISTENNYCGSYWTDSLHWDEGVLGLLEKDWNIYCRKSNRNGVRRKSGL